MHDSARISLAESKQLIIPIVLEPTWLSALNTLPPFTIKSEHLVIISPHPDDETLGAGGLIAAHCTQGGIASIVAVTDGENAYEDYPGLGAIRESEQAEAVDRLSAGRAKIVRLRLTDSGLEALEDELASMLPAFFPEGSHVIAPWTGDFHPDHEVCGCAAKKAAREVDAPLSWYFFWTWHRGKPSLLKELPLKQFLLDEDLCARKWQALQSHKSQLSHPSGEPILPDYLLAPARRNFEVFADA